MTERFHFSLSLRKDVSMLTKHDLDADIWHLM